PRNRRYDVPRRLDARDARARARARALRHLARRWLQAAAAADVQSQRSELWADATGRAAVRSDHERERRRLCRRRLRRLDERRAAVSEISDEALLAACGVGDTAALGALFDRHHDAMYRLISRLLRTEPSANDDLVQTTFMEAWRSAKRYDGRGSVRSFLF